MRQIDVTEMEVLCSGGEWEYDVSPCSKQAIVLLERNERLVTWLKPVNGGIEQQVAAIRYRSAFYTLSLRMMKAIYRHVRLYKVRWMNVREQGSAVLSLIGRGLGQGFKNVENVNGMLKQCIPELLLREKIRTQSRFDVCLRLRLMVCVLHSWLLFSMCEFWLLLVYFVERLLPYSVFAE